jgi:predicted RNA-binding Zn-ribbon protein involved in translation (DUF1610 family)
MPEHGKGLFDKYKVTRADGKPVGPTFTFEYERDPFAFYGLVGYANALANYPQFASLKADLDAITADINHNGMDCRLDCPTCGEKHVDEPTMVRHTSHTCEHCGVTWSPFPFPTRGIAK